MCGCTESQSACSVAKLGGWGERLLALKGPVRYPLRCPREFASPPTPGKCFEAKTYKVDTWVRSVRPVCKQERAGKCRYARSRSPLAKPLTMVELVVATVGCSLGHRHLALATDSVGQQLLGESVLSRPEPQQTQKELSPPRGVRYDVLRAKA
eukprot:5561382-Amphidinium_carterae.1